MPLPPSDFFRQARRLLWLAEQGRLPPCRVDKLEAVLNDILRGLQYDEALLKLAEQMPDKSLWSQAGRIEAALERFEATSWPRIRRGGRPPKGLLENAYKRVLEGEGPYGRRFIWEVLKAYRLLNETAQQSADTLSSIDSVLEEFRVDERRV